MMVSATAMCFESLFRNVKICLVINETGLRDSFYFSGMRNTRPESSNTRVTYDFYQAYNTDGKRLWTAIKSEHFRRFVSDVRHHHVWLRINLPCHKFSTLVEELVSAKLKKYEGGFPFWRLDVILGCGKPLRIYFNENRASRSEKTSLKRIPLRCKPR